MDNNELYSVLGKVFGVAGAYMVENKALVEKDEWWRKLDKDMQIVLDMIKSGKIRVEVIK